MSINGASVPIGATYAPSGGTATSLKTKKLDGVTHHAFLDDGSDLDEQVVAVFTNKEPQVSSGTPGGYSPARSSVLFKLPITLADGSSFVNTLKVEQVVSRETSAADKAAMRGLGLHALADADFTEFWDDQSQA
jgi:hypothetical protein